MAADTWTPEEVGVDVKSVGARGGGRGGGQDKIKHHSLLAKQSSGLRSGSRQHLCCFFLQEVTYLGSYAAVLRVCSSFVACIMPSR